MGQVPLSTRGKTTAWNGKLCLKTPSPLGEKVARKGRMRGTAKPNTLIDHVPSASPSSRCRDLLPEGRRGYAAWASQTNASAWGKSVAPLAERGLG